MDARSSRGGEITRGQTAPRSLSCGGGNRSETDNRAELKLQGKQVWFFFQKKVSYRCVEERGEAQDASSASRATLFLFPFIQNCLSIVFENLLHNSSHFCLHLKLLRIQTSACRPQKNKKNKMEALAIRLVQGKGIQMRRLQNSPLCLPFTRHQVLRVFLTCLFCRGSEFSEPHKLPEGRNRIKQKLFY